MLNLWQIKSPLKCLKLECSPLLSLIVCILTRNFLEFPRNTVLFPMKHVVKHILLLGVTRIHVRCKKFLFIQEGIMKLFSRFSCSYFEWMNEWIPVYLLYSLFTQTCAFSIGKEEFTSKLNAYKKIDSGNFLNVYICLTTV